MSWLRRPELNALGFRTVGDNVNISEKASFYNCAQIEIGDNVRIDDFCVLSAGTRGITIGSYVHIAVFTSLIGAGNITLSDFSNISSHVSIYSSNDDYSGSTMTNPMIPDKYKNVQVDDVKIGRHVVIGSGSVVLPGVEIHEGAAIGALSLVKSDCQGFKVYAGNPLKCLGKRSNRLLQIEAEFLKNK